MPTGGKFLGWYGNKRGYSLLWHFSKSTAWHWLRTPAKVASAAKPAAPPPAKPGDTWAAKMLVRNGVTALWGYCLDAICNIMLWLSEDIWFSGSSDTSKSGSSHTSERGSSQTRWCSWGYCRFWPQEVPRLHLYHSFYMGLLVDFTKCKVCVCVYFNMCCVTKGRTSWVSWKN